MKIAVTGKMRSGKDTLADYFIEKGLYKLAFADGIKEVITRYFPETIGKEKPREHYQLIGQTFRKLNPNVWIEFLDRELKVYGKNEIIVTDLRQPNEYEYLKGIGFAVVKVEAAEELRINRILESGEEVSKETMEHETEINVDSLPFDYLVSNNTTLEDLFKQAEFIYQELKGEQKR